jgi:hypothetical protein
MQFSVSIRISVANRLHLSCSVILFIHPFFHQTLELYLEFLVPCINPDGFSLAAQIVEYNVIAQAINISNY